MSDPYERGREFGEAQLHAIGNTVSAYRRLFASAGFAVGDVDDYGRRLHGYLSDGYGSVLAEIEGMAAGAGQSPIELLAVNARTEIRAAAPLECSTIAMLQGDADAVLAQNWDWHPDLRASRVVWEIQRPERRVTTFTEAGIVGKIGFNSDGLGVCLNAMRTTRDGPDVGVPIHILLRQILDLCSTTVQAEALVDATPTCASAAITIAGTNGGSAAVSCAEVTPGGTTWIRRTDGAFLHTNHFLREPLVGEDAVVDRWPDSVARYEEMARLVRRKGDVLDRRDIEAVLRSHQGVARSICCHEDDDAPYQDRCETLTSVIMNLSARELLLSDGPPCRSSYLAPSRISEAGALASRITPSKTRTGPAREPLGRG